MLGRIGIATIDHLAAARAVLHGDPRSRLLYARRAGTLETKYLAPEATSPGRELRHAAVY
jgi:hypothetical protein